MIIKPTIYQAVAIKIALQTYARHKILVNRAYTPKAMMATASRITGKTFRPRDYLGAAKALAAWCEAQKNMVPVDESGQSSSFALTGFDVKE